MRRLNLWLVAVAAAVTVLALLMLAPTGKNPSSEDTFIYPAATLPPAPDANWPSVKNRGRDYRSGVAASRLRVLQDRFDLRPDMHRNRDFLRIWIETCPLDRHVPRTGRNFAKNADTLIRLVLLRLLAQGLGKKELRCRGCLASL